MNLTTTYLGLKLRTPLVPSASPLSEDFDNLKRMEDAGASAIVFHSMFEEQVRHETQTLHPQLTHGTGSCRAGPATVKNKIPCKRFDEQGDSADRNGAGHPRPPGH